MASIYARGGGTVPEADKSIHAAGNQAASAPASVAAGPGPGAPDLEAASAAGLTISQSRACIQLAYCAVTMMTTSAVQMHMIACLTSST